MKAKTTDDVSSFDFFHLSSQEYDAIIKLYWMEAGRGVRGGYRIFSGASGTSLVSLSELIEGGEAFCWCSWVGVVGRLLASHPPLYPPPGGGPCQMVLNILACPLHVMSLQFTFRRH